ncbi:hypothetical protein ACGF0J_21915 [Nonomuraea sp. NPDC047897]|uniref:DUF7662 domain-containing protein n=1 Tax=Nonomuraea sp. NPDC047897 TaxID=3364346 RepID=UPI003716633D
MISREQYECLARHLQDDGRDHIELTFTEVARVIGEELPASASRHTAWWGSDPKHTQAIWLDAGYVARPNLTAGHVTFERRNPMSDDDIRHRLAAVDHIDWSTAEREHEREYFGDWLRFGPVLVPVGDPDDEAEAMEVRVVATFLQHAAADLRRLLTDLDAAQTAREAIMPGQPNPIYGKPNPGEPVRLLADAVEVLRPNGTTVTMDLVALADAAIDAERAVAGLREENNQLRARVEELERKAGRAERAGRMLSGVVDADDLPDGERDPVNRETVEDLANRVRELEQAVQRQEDYEREMRERGDA